MGEAYNALKARLADYTHLQQAGSLLSWDQETYMPAGAVVSRGDQMATLSKFAHELFVAPKTGRLLRQAAAEEGIKDQPDSDEAAIVRVSMRDYKRERKVPVAFVEELERTRAQSHQAWVEARKASDFKRFEPWLVKMFDMARRYADYLGYKEHPYDALLDGFEPDMKTSAVRATFADLREQLVPLVHAISAKADTISDAPLRRHFPREKQVEFATRVSRQFGYDLNTGRVDFAAHPFCTSFSSQDVRITTRVDDGFFNMMLFGTLHETGHALYDQGIDGAFAHTPLENGASLGIHESQSRMWENLVGRSHEFWEHYYPELQQVFPDQLGQVSLEEFYRAVNRVSPSFIRVEADEVTYNLHIMVRFELELELLEGKLKVEELPEAWNARYKAYLGITPPNDAVGVLQDTHWSIGLIGYFPTYSLGNLASVQLYEKIEQDIPTLRDSIRAGDFSPLLGWLRQNIHQYGRKYTPDDLLKRATGRSLSAEPYMNYLRAKYSAIYGL
ncbi:MAG: carboxypeptidase M32 [Chloroflexi bacterium]|nr:carboxypeptidase M32 [Chloroflexota bacterium]MCL5275670.1 carboxypeptidase M32 [Chloroflexota bacterium]